LHDNSFDYKTQIKNDFRKIENEDEDFFKAHKIILLAHVAE
jgi:hypothetical protein